MRLGYISSVLVSGFLTCSSALAAPTNWRSVDVLPFEVASLRIGMGYDQTLSEIGNHFQLSAAEVSHIKKSTIYAYSRITKKQQPSSIIFKRGYEMLEVSFAVRLPVNQADPVAVSRIHYGIPNTQENIAQLKEAALSKYGQPSDNRRQANLMWCAHYNQITQCDLAKPRLSLSLGALVLEDPTLAEDGKKYEQGLPKTGPNI